MRRDRVAIVVRTKGAKVVGLEVVVGRESLV
jgi:hypothetical protein